MTSTISLPAPTPVPPPPPSLPSSSSAYGMNGITGLSPISSTSISISTSTSKGHCSSSGINSSDGRPEFLSNSCNNNNNIIRNGKLLSSMSSAVGINGGTGQQAHSSSSSSHLPTLNEPPISSPAHQDSDSDAETVVVASQSRGRSRSNRPRSYHENDDGHDDDRLAPSSHSRKTTTNGDSKSSRPDRGDDDAYSSDLSSAPSSSRAPSKRPPPKDPSRKRTASPSRLTHSPHRRKIPKIQDDDPDKRRSLKRKAREVSHERGIKSEDESPRGIRIKSSPPMSPPPVPRESNGTKHPRDSHTSTNNNTSSATLLSRPGHSRKRSVPNLGPSSGKSSSGNNTSVSKLHKSKRSGRPPALNIQDSDNEAKSTSSSRSNSPHITNNRRRRPSISGHAASPARLIGPGHKMKRDKTGRNQLHKVCAKGVLDEAKACLEAEPDLLNDADNAGYLPIHAAALAGHDDIVEWLIEEGAQVDKPAEDLSTPLLDAVENMHVAVVNTLLEHGADPRHRNKAGQSSIDLASTIRQQSDDPEEEAKMSQIEDALRAALVKLKNKKRADDEARKTANESCSSRAASVASPSHFSPPPQSNHISSSRRRGGRGEPTRNEFLWLDAGKGGQAKLKQASRDGDMEMAGKLLESGINPDPESMMLAARGGHLDVLNLLVAFGGDSDPDPKDVIRQHTKDKSQFPLIAGEETPLLATIGRNNIEVLKLLLRSESMKEPRRLDSRGRSYVEIAKQRGGENWEEEVKLLQAAFDSAGPQKSKKSSREKLDSSSPVASRKDRDKENSKDKDRKSDRKEAKTDELKKKPKRLRQRSASPAASSAMDDTAPSEREISPAIPRSKLKDLDKQKRKERTVDSDYSAISDSNATADGTKTKKRRLVLGKDLAAKSEKEDKPSKADKEEKEKEKPKEKPKEEKLSRKRSDEMEVDHPAKREKEKEKEKDSSKEKKKKDKVILDEEDIEMPDAPRPKKRLADPERHTSKRDHSLDKRQRESSSSSNKPIVNDHNSDADVHTKVEMVGGKKRRKLEDDVETPKAKSKDDRQSEAADERPKSKEERKAEREIRRAEADKAAKMKAKAEKAEKSEKPASTDIVGKDTDEALLERKREKKKRRDEALREQATKDTPVKESKESDTTVSKRTKERDTTASDIEGKKSRSEKERSVQKDKDAMDIDSEVPTTKRRKPSGDSNPALDDAAAKIKKRKSNGASPAPSASDEKNGTRHLNDLSNGKSNRGSSIREEIKAKVDPNDDAMLTEERERELERQRIEKEQKEQERKKQEAAKQQEEKRREQERLDQERAAERLRLQKQQEEERRKQIEAMRLLEAKLYGTSSQLQSHSHNQAQSQLAGDKARFDEMQRINSLPSIYRDALMSKNKEEFAQGLWQNYRKILPLYCVEYGETKERWVSNAQACVLLGVPHDLDLTMYPNLERRPVTLMEQQALKQNFHALYSSYNSPQTIDFDVRLEMERQETEQNKFLALTNVFWLKASDLCKIFLSNDRYRHITDKYLRNSQLPSVILWIEGQE